MNIAFTSSDEYAQYMGIALLSLLDNNKKVTEINIYILDANISMKNKEFIKQISKKYNRNIYFLDKMAELKRLVDKYNLPYFRENYNPYFKIFPHILNLNVDKLLFLDSDLIINKELSELYDMDITNYYCAVMPEISAYFGYGDDEEVIHMNKYYYNTGVILWNLKKYNQDNYFQKLLDAKNKYNKRLRLADQSLLSIAADDDDIYPLHYKYNLNCCLLSRPKEKYLPVFHKYKECGFEVPVKKPFKSSNIVIYHYESCRPWIRWRMAAFGYKYKKYWRKSPWKNVPRESMFLQLKEDIMYKNPSNLYKIPFVGNSIIALKLIIHRYFYSLSSAIKRVIFNKVFKAKKNGCYLDIPIFGKTIKIFRKKYAIDGIRRLNKRIRNLEKELALEKKMKKR